MTSKSRLFSVGSNAAMWSVGALGGCAAKLERESGNARKLGRAASLGKVMFRVRLEDLATRKAPSGHAQHDGVNTRYLGLDCLSAPDQMRQVRSARALGGCAAKLERETRHARQLGRALGLGKVINRREVTDLWKYWSGIVTRVTAEFAD
jgi:hypothetical protein